MKMFSWWWRNHRQIEEDAYSDTNDETFLKEDSYTPFQENPRQTSKYALAIFMAFNIFLLVLNLNQYWGQGLNNDPFQQLYSKFGLNEPANKADPNQHLHSM